LNPVAAARGIAARNSNALLLVLCLGQFMVILDVSIVNVALPSIRIRSAFPTRGFSGC
jgi:cyanate permease